MKQYLNRRIRHTNSINTLTNNTRILGPSIWEPEFYIQTTNTGFIEDVWSLPNFYPIVYVNLSSELYWQFGPTFPNAPMRGNDPSGWAKFTVDWIEWYSSGILREQGRQIDKYSLQLQGFGCYTSGNYPSLYYNENDYVNDMPSPWVTSGIIETAPWTYNYVQALKAELVARNLPNPSRLDLDTECVINVTGIESFLNHPLATTRLVDGRKTLSEYWSFNDNRLPNGDELTESLHGGYDWQFEWWATNIRSVIGDYALYESCYKYFVSGFPGIKTSNYGYYGGSLNNPAHSAKNFHSTHYLTNELYATDHIGVNYEVYFIDRNDQPGWDEQLYGTFTNCLEFYGVENTGTINNIVRQMYINKAGFQATSIRRGASGDDWGIWHWYQPSSYIFDSNFVSPTGAILNINSQLLIDIFKEYGSTNIPTILIFEPQLSEAIADAYYNAILASSGYVPTSYKF